jgi:hypothetical protein
MGPREDAVRGELSVVWSLLTLLCGHEVARVARRWTERHPLALATGMDATSSRHWSHGLHVVWWNPSWWPHATWDAHVWHSPNARAWFFTLSQVRACSGVSGGGPGKAAARLPRLGCRGDPARWRTVGASTGEQVVGMGIRE